MKRKYEVEFYYYSDLRYKATVEARSDVGALAIAEESDSSLVNWCDIGEGFHIVISIKR